MNERDKEGNIESKKDVAIFWDMKSILRPI